MTFKTQEKAVLYVLFALSGFCALVYEILWTKYLSLAFGTTMTAVSIVAATFMGGLALGSLILGRLADRRSNLLRLYALLEVGIATFALLFPHVQEVAVNLHVLIERLGSGHHAFAHAVHFLFAALLLLPPTICMGGTFPVMCRLFARRKLRGEIGRLYALNTLGATLGAFMAGFLLIPALGLSSTGHLAVAGNLLIAAAGFLIGQPRTKQAPQVTADGTLPAEGLHPTRHRVILAGIGLVGAFSLAYEILWTRVFVLFLGNTTFAFSLMLSAYLVGIALGGAIFSRKIRPDTNVPQLFIVLSTCMALAILVTAPFYDYLAYAFQAAHDIAGDRWWLLSLLSYLIVFAVMLLPTLLSGSLLPAAVAILAPGRGHAGEGVGMVVLCNTLGAVLGSLIAGFVLIPGLGTLGSFQLLAGLNLLLAVALFFRYRRRIRRQRLIPALALLGLVIALLPVAWNQKLMNSGVYCYAANYRKNGGILEVLSQEKILQVIEGIETTVAVHESLDGRHRFFTVNGKTDGGTTRDMGTQILVGQLPMLLHPSPREVLVIGLGTGITLRGMSAHPTDRIDCMEISPEVAYASSYFDDANGYALMNPKVRLTIEDGRNHLLVTPKKYDVIVSEPSNPWQTGNANLFTADFYDLAARRLKEDGLFCQWIGIYDITPENLRVAVNTFLQTFDQVLAFQSGADLILVGADHKLSFDYRRLQDRLKIPAIRDALQTIDLHSPGDLLARHYFCSERELQSFAAGAPLNTDDRPILEFSGRHLLGPKTLGAFQMENMASLMKHLGRIALPLTDLGSSPAQVAAALRDIGKCYARNGRMNEARNFMIKAAQVEGQPLVSLGSSNSEG